MIPARQPHPDDLFLITREELDRCCSQMSAAGYKVSANYIEALVLSRPHISTPAPARDFVNTPEKPWCYPGCMLVSNAEAEAAKAAREQAQQSIDAAIEQLSDINKYACEEYEEANLSDNEREMRIHLEYGNRVWEVVRFLRSQQDNTSTKGGDR